MLRGGWQDAIRKAVLISQLMSSLFSLYQGLKCRWGLA